MGFEADVKAAKDWLKSGGMHSKDRHYRFLRLLIEKSAEKASSDPCERSFSREDIFGDEDDIPVPTDPRRQNRLRDISRGAREFLAARTSQYHDFLRVRGLKTALKIIETPGGGAGRPTLYHLESEPLPASKPSIPRSDNSLSVITYAEAVPSEIRLSWEGRLAFGKKATTGISAGSFVTSLRLIVVLYLYAIPLWIIWMLYMLIPQTITTQTFGIGLALTIFTIAYWKYGLKPYGWMLDRRMMRLPDRYLTGDQPSTQLEKIPHPDDEDKVLLCITRYHSTCAHCGGEVFLKEGGLAWPDRLVGRCILEPQEHVFSFDRVSLLGRPLREVTMAERPIE